MEVFGHLLEKWRQFLIQDYWPVGFTPAFPGSGLGCGQMSGEFEIKNRNIQAWDKFWLCRMLEIKNELIERNDCNCE